MAQPSAANVASDADADATFTVVNAEASSERGTAVQTCSDSGTRTSRQATESTVRATLSTTQAEEGPIEGPQAELASDSSSVARQPGRYQLRILQQPITGCAFGDRPLARLPLAPPLLLQVRLQGNDSRLVHGQLEADSPFLICQVRLLTPIAAASASGDSLSRPAPTTGSAVTTTAADVVTTIESSIRRGWSCMTRSMLYGTLTASPIQLTDGQGHRQVCFAFPEMSVRYVGRFCLQAHLYRLPLAIPAIIPQQHHDSKTTGEMHGLEDPVDDVPTSTPTNQALATITTEPFDVVDTHRYVAPSITDLTRFFADNGVTFAVPNWCGP